jgi:mono/diheme cytochrome c family protein
MCTRQSHEDLKNDSMRWARETERIGEINVGDGNVIVLANCRACHSTLVVRDGRTDCTHD